MKGIINKFFKISKLTDQLNSKFQKNTTPIVQKNKTLIEQIPKKQNPYQTNSLSLSKKVAKCIAKQLDE